MLAVGNAFQLGFQCWRQPDIHFDRYFYFPGDPGNRSVSSSAICREVIGWSEPILLATVSNLCQTDNSHHMEDQQMPATITPILSRKSKQMITVRNKQAPKPYDGQRQHLTKAELHKLFATLKENRGGKRDYLMALIGYLHALRASELVALRWDAINWQSHQLTVGRLKGSVDGIRHDLEDDEYKLLRQMREERRKAGIDKPHIFLSERGEQFGRMGFYQTIARAGAAIGLPWLHPHCLRHSRLQHLADDGAQAAALRAISGHSSNQGVEPYLKTVAIPLAKLPKSPR